MLVRGRGSPLRGRKKGLFTKKNIFISHLRFDKKKGAPRGLGILGSSKTLALPPTPFAWLFHPWAALDHVRCSWPHARNLECRLPQADSLSQDLGTSKAASEREFPLISPTLRLTCQLRRASLLDRAEVGGRWPSLSGDFLF